MRNHEKLCVSQAAAIYEVLDLVTASSDIGKSRFRDSSGLGILFASEFLQNMFYRFQLIATVGGAGYLGQDVALPETRFQQFDSVASTGGHQTV